MKELAKQRNQIGLPGEYDRTCASIPKEESDERVSKGEVHVVRLKAPASPPEYFDLVYGSVGKPKSKKPPPSRGGPIYDDSILIKSDGLPTYHLANVVDDHHMKITHVIRASEWMSSTPKHLAMYDAFGWEPPQFAHVGLLQDLERQKFSKRKADLDIRTFENDGIFPEALVNYVVLHGWSHTLGNDFLTLQDLIRNFDLKFTKGNTIVDPAKLTFLQKKYSKKYAEEGGAMFESMVDRVYTVAEQRLHLKEKDTDLRSRIAAFMRRVPETYTTPKGFYERNNALFEPVQRAKFVPIKDRNGQEILLDTEFLSVMNHELTKPPLAENTPWTAVETKRLVNNAIRFIATIDAVRKEPKEGHDISKLVPEAEQRFYAAVHHYLRWAITGGKPSSTVVDCMVLLGREETARRIKDAARMFESQTREG